MTRLAAHDVVFGTARTPIVGPTTVTLESGAHVTVVGPNGAGKTTLLRLLAGELAPSAGRVTVDGTNLSELSHSELAVLRALMTNDGPADIPLRVDRVVALGRDPHRRTDAARSDAAVAGALERVGIGHLARRVVGTLSGGERVLVSLARILAQDTPIVLLDEPTAQLDVARGDRTMALLDALAAEGRLVVTVGHDLNAVARHADRCLVMAGGAVVADGSPHEALTPGLLTEIYEHPMLVLPHPRGGPLIVAG